MSILDFNSLARGDSAAIVGETPVVWMNADSASLMGEQANRQRLASATEATVGERMHDLATRLYPICRSLTGAGTRETLHILREQIPLEIHAVPSGTTVFDWQTPEEWNLHSARLESLSGETLIDARNCNLHVVNYSEPVDAVLTWRELRPHLHTAPDRPDWIPYRTSYYHRAWGFCLTQRQFDCLAAAGEDARYRARIEATLAPGELNYGELFLPGETDDEVLFSCHVCHPSLANDNLSGMVVAVELAKSLMHQSRRRYGYRFLFVPATIGALCWLSANQERVERIKHGLVLTLLGDAGGFTYKQSRHGNAEIDRAVAHLLVQRGKAHQIRPFTPQGYDERQYGSPGFNMSVGCLMRTPHGEYPEYHTSADNLDFIRPAALEDSWRLCREVVVLLEANRRYQNLSPYGEPQLGRRGLYQRMGGDSREQVSQTALQWVLNFSDGENSLLDIAERAGLPFDAARRAATLLVEAGLLLPVGANSDASPLSIDELWES